jgi:hypothetical protein
MMLPRVKCVCQFVSTFVLVLLMQGCQSTNPMLDTFSLVLPAPVQVANLAPGFEYLWVSVDGKASVMALGARETRGTAVHEHWYTGQGEMLHLVNGRVQQALGFTHELRQQTGAPPAWGRFDAALVQATQDVVWTRQLDVMPGYRFGVQETVVSRTVAQPTRLPEGVPAHTQWVADEVLGKKANGLPWVYAQRFAVANGRVVYSEQCLAPAVCLKLRPLGVVVP